MSYKNHKDQKLLAEAYKNINFNKSQSINEEIDVVGPTVNTLTKAWNLGKSALMWGGARAKGLSIQAATTSKELANRFKKYFLPSRAKATKDFSFWQQLNYGNEFDDLRKTVGKKTTYIPTNRLIYIFLSEQQMFTSTLLELYRLFKSNPALIDQENNKYLEIFDKSASEKIDLKQTLSSGRTRLLSAYADKLTDEMEREDGDSESNTSPTPSPASKPKPRAPAKKKTKAKKPANP